MAEKCSRQLPAIRITESLETALMRLAARDDRTLSEFIRLVLERHAFGHAASVVQEDEVVSLVSASQRSA